MLTVDGLKFRYAVGGEELFGGLSHDFDAGQVTVLTGPSGRGKSTLLYILGLMLTPTAGSVVVAGRPASALSDAERSRIRGANIGFVFQDAALDPTRTILDAVAEPALYAGETRASARSRALSLLRDMNIDARAHHRPGAISGGQAQRVAVARALSNDPGIILADEPTGNLDQVNSDGVLAALRRVADQGRIVVIASHDAHVLGQGDCTVRLGALADLS